MTDTTATEVSSTDVKSSENLTFNPPVYIQRYLAIQSILGNEEWKKKITKVAEFGCAEFKLLKYLKSLKNIEHIIAIDIDERLMRSCEYEAKPKIFEHLASYSRKLTVDLFIGDIAEHDSRLLGVDAIICIELIEHLHEATLEKVPATVFEFLRPKLAIFTTPNAEFNVLLNLTGFRHDDHKFEWTRSEFEMWCNKILKKYPDYKVYYDGIGRGPEGTEHLGCVSQMAVFVRNNLEDSSVSLQVVSEPYSLYKKIVYPYYEDKRSNTEKLMDEIKYRINDMIMSRKYHDDEPPDDNVYEIPVNYLQTYVNTWCPTKESLVEQLIEKGYNVRQSGNESVIAVVDSSEEDSSDSSDPISDEECDKLITYNSHDETWD